LFFIALATDYDGTLAELGVVADETLEALRQFKRTGRKLILVTGRELDDLKKVFTELSLFDRVVVENGAVIYDPANEDIRAIAPPPPPQFVDALRAKNVTPLSVGHSIVATWEPNEGIVLETIRDMGLELQIIFNKGAVMVLPAGVNKASGLAAALAELELSPHNVVAVGDAENDHAFLRACGCSVAVANALPMLKETADFVTQGERGAGVVELMSLLAATDAAIAPFARHGINIGADSEGVDIRLNPTDSVLIAGKSGIGKSTIATALTERMVEKGQQFCVLDPEGDYLELDGAVCVGNAKTAPSESEVFELLRRPDVNVVVCAIAVAAADRPAFFAKLLGKIGALRLKSARPHWLIVDEAHHVLPSEHGGLDQTSPSDLPATVLITVHPESVQTQALKTLEAVVALGDEAEQVIAACCAALGIATPPVPKPKDDEVLFWRCHEAARPRPIKPIKSRQARKRHSRKYAEGELGPDRSFYFKGPKGALNLRAQNLMLFVQIGAGVDDATWDHHLRAGDYSQWMRSVIKNDELADEVATVERDGAIAASESRKRISEAILSRYTTPAQP
jgi:hydroxymethylpyrimidine pyrophosphatase-like HAD family hydrolase/energy-coupling factor transporter ATP-binding protein EcfA2